MRNQMTGDRRLGVMVLQSMWWRISSCVALLVCTIKPGIAEEKDALQLFESRIMPIFNSEKPSSCIQCHLSSIDLRQYIQPSHKQTFLALRDNGLIDVQRPLESEILELISKGIEDPDSQARRLHARTREMELSAFSAWIVASCKDEDLVNSSTSDSVPALPTKPTAVVEFTRKNRVLDSFVRNVWSQRMRCFPCHTPHEIDSENPKHVKPLQRQQDFVAKYGQRVNLFRESPEATLRHWTISSRKQSRAARARNDLPLLNFASPQESLFLLKPLAKLPPKNDEGQFAKSSASIPVSHMGGIKMHRNDQSYKAIAAWIQDYANVLGDTYGHSEDLPMDNWFPTQQIVRLKSVPQSWEKLSVVQVFVHARSNDENWDAEPIAFTQGLVTPRKMVNGALFLIKPTEGNAARLSLAEWQADKSRLSPGRYLLKIYYDQHQKLDQNPLLLLDESDFVVEVEITAEWSEGFPNAQVVELGDAS